MDPWLLPGPRAFRRRCESALRGAANLVVLGASAPLGALLPLLRHSFRVSGPLDWYELPLPDDPLLRDNPRELLREHFQADSEPPTDLAPWSCLMSTVLAVPWLDSVNWASWWAYLEAWIQRTQAIPPAERPLLALFAEEASTGGAPPRGQPRLEILRLPDSYSPLDLRVLTDEALSELHESPLERELRLELCVELCGGDPELAERLAERSLSELMAPDPEKATSRDLARWRALVRVLFPLLEDWKARLLADARPYLGGEGAERQDPGKILHHLHSARGLPSAIRRSAEDLARLRNELAHGNVVPHALLQSQGLARLQRTPRTPGVLRNPST